MSREPSAAPPFLSELVIGITAVAISIAYVEYRAAIQIPPAVVARCAPPKPLEQLLIVATVRQANGKANVEAACMYAGARGSYTKPGSQ